jgi:hypothetical protein
LLAPAPGEAGRRPPPARGRAPVDIGAGIGAGAARGDPEALRAGQSPVPLPRRSGRSRVPAPLPTDAVPAVHPVTGQSWATDVPTMRRLLTALRSLR